MSQKKISPPVKKVLPAKKAASAAPLANAGKSGSAGKTAKTVAFDAQRMNDFVLGRITLAEVEGIGKDIQYKIAETGYRVLNEGKLDSAKAIFKGLLALDPYDSYFHTALGSIQQREGNYEEAEKAYTHALKFNPYNSSALANRGEIRFKTGKIWEAAEDIKNAVANDPDGKDPATLRARLLALAISDLIAKNQDAILEQLKQAKKGKPGAAPAKSGKPGAGPIKKK